MTKICMMIDLETLSTRANAVIVSGAYVIFNREGNEYYEAKAYYSKFNIQEQLDNGHKVDASTIKWWFDQSDEIRKEFQGHNEDASDIWMFMDDIKRTISPEYPAEGTLQIEEVWSKGADFDISLLQNLYSSLYPDQKLWNYKLPRCFRTIQALYPDCYEENPLAHNALEDARNQAKELWRITQKYLLPNHQD